MCTFSCPEFAFHFAKIKLMFSGVLPNTQHEHSSESMRIDHSDVRLDFGQGQTDLRLYDAAAAIRTQVGMCRKPVAAVCRGRACQLQYDGVRM